MQEASLQVHSVTSDTEKWGNVSLTSISEHILANISTFYIIVRSLEGAKHPQALLKQCH